MSVWNTTIWGNDVACDVRDSYRELIEDGVDDAEATRQTCERFGQSFTDPEDGTASLVGFAIAQSRIGRLDPAIRERAVALIDRGGDLDIWARDNPKKLEKRRAVLEKARAELMGPQPARKRLKPPKRILCDLVQGDVLALDLPDGPVLFRTVLVRSDRYGEEPYMEALAFKGAETPPVEIIQQLPAVPAEDPMFSAPRFWAMHDVKQGGWKEAGFRKVGNTGPREGDEVTGFCQDGTFWFALAMNCRKEMDG